MQDICDRIAILHRGELKELGKVSDLLTVQDITQIKARDLSPAALQEIRDVIARHGGEISFSYGATFTNPWQEELARALVAMNPRIASRVYFVSGGSEGVETAVKMARQYHLQCGRPGRHKVIARWQSFHGSTLATLA